ncbi:hypothetical protein GCM10028895_01560 [Pontibacter rugosus]
MGCAGSKPKAAANFSQYKHYYNPALTGYEGSVIRSLYRNQWTGFEDAPKTILASAEIGTGIFKGTGRKYHFRNDNRTGSLESISAKHALGLTVLSDKFGPLRETQLALSYGSGIRLSETLSLRWGAAFTYAAHRVDGSSLNVVQKDDPRYTNLAGGNNSSSIGDINLGLSLVSANYYLGYGMQGVTEGRLLSSGDKFMEDAHKLKHLIQAGYRQSITDQLGFTVNALYLNDEEKDALLEGQVKAVYNNMFWAGAGYRNELAYNVTAGVRVNQLVIGYTYESPIQNAKAIDKATNEITLSYILQPIISRSKSSQLSIW